MQDDIEECPDIAGSSSGEGVTIRGRSKNAPVFPRSESDAVPGGGRCVYVKSYGCGHNVSDGEVMAGLLSKAGYNVTSNVNDPNVDVFLVNSCTVKNPSESSFRSLVDSCKQQQKPVVVTGCVPQGDAKKAEKDWGDVSVIGVQQIERVVEVVDQALQGNRVHLLGRSKKEKPSLDLPKIRKNPFVEIIPINLGCLGSCTYCKTVHARGALTSYAPEEILARVRQVIADGVREIRLTSEDAGAYGLDIGTNIVELLKLVLPELPDGTMLKLGMTNPPYMLQRLEGIAECMNHPRMYSFVHIPVQSGSNAVLAKMNREYTREDFEQVCDTLLKLVPGLQIATDIICGFPGETEEDFEETMDLVRKYRFPVVNISQFYARPGTPAARFKQLSSQIVKDRSRRLSEFFNSGISSPYQKLQGSKQRVFVTEMAADKHNLCGHNKSYVQVILPPTEAKMGTDVECTISDATGRFYCRGVIVKRKQSFGWIPVALLVLLVAIAAAMKCFMV